MTTIGSIELDEKHIVLFDIESPFGNIDFVVVGRDKGIFLILKKAHRGKIEFKNGQLLRNDNPLEKDFITEALQSSFWLEQKILSTLEVKIRIIPLLVFTNAAVQPMLEINGVQVISFDEISKILSNGTTEGLNMKIWENRSKLLALSNPVEKPLKLMAEPA